MMMSAQQSEGGNIPLSSAVADGTENPSVLQKEVINRTQSGTLPAEPPETPTCAQRSYDSPNREIWDESQSQADVSTPSYPVPKCDIHSLSPSSGEVTSKPPVAPTQASGSSGILPEVTLPLLTTPPPVQPVKKSRGPSEFPATVFYPQQEWNIPCPQPHA